MRCWRWGLLAYPLHCSRRKKQPDWRIAVVDADPLGGGGTSKNAGFACFGSATELNG